MESMKLTIEDSKEYQNRYKVTQEDGRFSDGLDFGEMLSLITGLAIPDGWQERCSKWMKTEQEHKDWEKKWIKVDFEEDDQ